MVCADLMCVWGGGRGFFGKKPGKKLSDDKVQCADGTFFGVVMSASGGIFYDGVQLEAVGNSLRVHVQVVR